MLLFLDTANLDEIREIAEWGVLGGVTTNPTLVVKEHQDFKKLVKDICKIVSGPVSAEVTATDTEGMVKEGRDIATWAENCIVKLQSIQDAGFSSLDRFRAGEIFGRLEIGQSGCCC